MRRALDVDVPEYETVHRPSSFSCRRHAGRTGRTKRLSTIGHLHGAGPFAVYAYVPQGAASRSIVNASSSARQSPSNKGAAPLTCVAWSALPGGGGVKETISNLICVPGGKASLVGNEIGPAWVCTTVWPIPCLPLTTPLKLCPGANDTGAPVGAGRQRWWLGRWGSHADIF